MSNEPRDPPDACTESYRRRQILEASFEVARDGTLEDLTIRRVADRAGISHGLVHHYFETKKSLLREFLEWLLDTMEHPIPTTGPQASAVDFVGAVEEAMERAFDNPDRINLFFQFWVMGLRESDIRTRLRQELDRYRDSFVHFAERAAAGAECDGRIDPQGLAALAVAVIHGCAVQAAVNPSGFDIGPLRRAFRTVFERLDSAPGRTRGARTGA